MSAPILKTKIYIPPSRPNTVLRPRLSDQLSAGVHGRLTLISAPAGFGKTTLLSEWVATSKEPAAWLSLDEEHSDSTRFLAYLVAALRTLALPTADEASHLGEDILRALQSSQPPVLNAVLTALINELASVSSSFILILDDYHLIESQAVDQAISFVLQHLPQPMHLIIATREDPSLPLARLRARGQLTELRAHDLRFTQSEVAEFLNKAMNLNLSVENINALENRTEGWIAGLQLAAISLQGHRNTSSLISSFSGSHRFVLDYLVEEILHQQPEPIQHFLLCTSILDRLCGSLCDALLPQAFQAGQEVLEYLERANLLLVPLDEQHQWFRYHHLFGEALRVRLPKAHPDDVVTLHRRASAWYRQHNLYSEAVRHALAAFDFERAADLIEMARPAIAKGRRDVTFLGWMKRLPDELIRRRPVLNVGYALALQDANELEDAAERLHAVEQWLESGAIQGEGTTPMVVVDEAQLQALPASIATAQVMHTLASGDISGTIARVPKALEQIPPEDHLRRGQIVGLLGLAQWARGDLEAAQQSMVEAGALTQKVGTILDTIPGIFVVADIQVIRGQLGEAVDTYEQALRLAAEHNAPTHLGIEKVYAGLSELYCERGELNEATQTLAMSETLGERFGDSVWHHRWYVALARLKETQGDWDGALEQLHKAEHLYILNPLSHMRPIGALKTQIWLKQGRLTAAEAWVRERNLSIEDELSYAREFEHITLARLIIAQHKYNRDKSVTRSGTIQEATELLTRLLNAAEAGGRFGSVLEILLILALAHASQDDVEPALDALERALVLAEPEDYVRVFVNEGSPMEQLLSTAANCGIMPLYTRKLLSAFDTMNDKITDVPYLPEPDSQEPISPKSQPLVEPLSQRELDVLRLLQTELTGPQIADELVVALSTVRTHTKNIYGKLNVNNRRAAVIRAAELDLI